MIDLERIYLEYHGKVLGYVYNRVKNQAAAEDLCADVFVKLASKLDSFDEQKASISTWIYTIMRNTLYDYFRTRREHSELDAHMAADTDFVEALCTEAMLEALADALETLPKRERELMIRRYYYDQSLKEIALRLGISYSYAKLLHAEALKTLKKLLSDD